MYAGFGEDTYAANHLGEIRLRYGAAVFGAPRLAGAIEEPTLRQERDLGFDARIRIELGSREVIAIYLQYKGNEVISSRRAAEADCWDHCVGPYYRFSLRQDEYARRNPKLPLYRQNRLLVALRRAGDVAAYAAPCFHGMTELDELVVRNSLLGASVYIDPLQIGDVRDREDHHVSYSMRGSRCAVHSTFRKLERPDTWDDLLRKGRVREATPSSLQDIASALRELVMDNTWGGRGRQSHRLARTRSRGDRRGCWVARHDTGNQVRRHARVDPHYALGNGARCSRG
jgi:hypothetical protein